MWIRWNITKMPVVFQKTNMSMNLDEIVYTLIITLINDVTLARTETHDLS